jgi:hypothetical protein
MIGNAGGLTAVAVLGVLSIAFIQAWAVSSLDFISRSSDSSTMSGTAAGQTGNKSDRVL